MDTFTDWAASFLIGVGAAWCVILLGGPNWAAFGTGVLAYFVIGSRRSR